MNPISSQPTIPSIAQATIERPILLEKLNLAHQHKLTLIAAPSGYGKMTLLTQFVRQAKYPVTWHTVEKRERDLTELFVCTVCLFACWQN